MNEVDFYAIVQRCNPGDVPALMDFLQSQGVDAQRMVRRAARGAMIRGFAIGVATTLVGGVAWRVYRNARW